MKKIVLTGGGTAGHVIPNIALLPELQKHFDEIIYIGSGKEIEKKLVEKESIAYYSVSAVKYQRNNPLSLLKIPFLLEKAIKEAMEILKNIKPSVVFSKGGYVSLPTVFAAHKLNIPVVVHESDFSLGLANKVSLPYCKKYITSFPTTPLKSKGVFIGQPIRETIFKGNKNNVLDFKNDRQNLLVVGGSTGAKNLNDFIYKIKDELNFNIIHITGKGKNDGYIQNDFYKTYEYLENIYDYYDWSDVILSRAGAGACFEISALNKRAVFVPLENKASRGDQLLNANYYSGFNNMEVLYEKDFSKDNLLKAISNATNNKKNPYVFDRRVNEKIVSQIIECM